MGQEKNDAPVRSDALDENGYYVVPRTFRELASARQETLATLRDEGMVVFSLSCDECSRFAVCQWAFDPYNTNGDCLDEK